jgi:hypothetical protein
MEAAGLRDESLEVILIAEWILFSFHVLLERL